MLRALDSASFDITHQTGGAICFGHWVLRLMISYTTEETICYGHWVLHLVLSYTRQWVRFVTYDVLWALDSASKDITYETGGTICFEYWLLRLLISHTRQGVRFVAGIGFCVM